MQRTTMLGTAIGVGIMLALGAPIAASAHVTITPDSAEPGSYALVTLKVPNESETAATNRLEVSLPTDTPFTSVRTVPVPGWTAELVRGPLPEPVMLGETEITEAVTAVIWTAQPGAEIQDGQLQLFPLSLGPVPDVDSVTLPAEQGYTDGTTVSWSEEGEEAEHPAPVLFVNGVVVGHGVEPAAEAPAAPDVLARVLGIAGLVVGAIGLVVAVATRRQASR